ncbi:fungal-specific transcription factor domain-containing protein, partial [Stachybotrys elegans]
RPPKPARRSRVSLACQRCKHRKQKCNGGQPSCGRCLKLNLSCHYVVPAYPKPVQAKIYIKALEDRVAELETVLKNGGDRTVSDDHWTIAAALPTEGNWQDQDEIQPLVNAVRDLSHDVAGSYIGGASTITLGRALGKALAGRSMLSLPALSPEDGRLGPTHAPSNKSHAGSLECNTFSLLTQMSQETADALVHAYLKHMCTNFPIIFSFEILDLHKRRLDLDDIYEESILQLIYGLGIHFLQKTSETSLSYDPEQFYFAALEERDSILRLGDTRALTYLMLLGQHCYRMPKDPGAWTFYGLAMKMCVELGLHRQRRSSKVCLKSERNKRLFWICYWHERELAVAMGRPPSICDHDIDVELPLDVDEATQDLDVFQKASEQDRSIPPFPPTSLSTLIHLLRLKRIESAIQHSIYRVDRLQPSEDLCQKTDEFLEKLLAWKSVIPQQEYDQDMLENQIYLSYDSYMASYHKTLRILLQPRLYERNVQDRYLGLCAEACRGVCETYKRLHTTLPISFTSLSLQSVFLAGLTLIYCMWIDNSTGMAFRNHSALTDCSIMLYVMAERWQVGKKYRDLFELVKKSVLDAIQEGRHAPRTAVASLKDGMQTSLQQLQVDTEVENVADDLEQMISDMTGEAIPAWHDETLSLWTMNESSNIFSYIM